MIILRSRPCEPCTLPSFEKYKSTDLIIYLAAQHFEIPLNELMTGRLKRAIVFPRQLLLTYLINTGKENLSSAARLFKIDRATVRYGIKNMNRWRAVYSDYRKKYDDMVEAIIKVDR